MPVVVMNSLSADRRFTTFVSPVTIATPANAAAAAIDATTRDNSSIASPSSMMKAADSQSGLAPLIAKSLTVPFTASSPMFPPGKNSGVTTNESVVKATRAEPTSNTAWSSIFRKRGLSKAGRNRSWINCALSLPPLPWPITTVLWCERGSGHEIAKVADIR